MNNQYLQNKVFLVTGSGSGIGLETVRHLLFNNAFVIGLIRKSSSSLNSLIKQYPDRLHLYTGDVSLQPDCEAFIEYATKKTKIIHGLIHCAGVGMRSSARDISHDVFHKIMETNFSSSVYLFHAIRHHLEKTRGHFVAVSSIQGLMTLPYRSVYSAAKHALNAYIKSIRLEEKNINFLIVNFGYVNTGFSGNALRGNGEKYLISDEGQKKGMSAQKAAQWIIKSMIKRKKQVTPAGIKEKFALAMHRFFPVLYDKLIIKYVKLK